MKREIENPYPNGECFFCGHDSCQGLRLTFWWDEERREVTTNYVPERRFVGQGDILHGAIQMGLLDEIMGWTTVVTTGQMAVTTQMNVMFLRPVYVHEGTITATCRVTGREGRDVELEADLTDDQGIVCTTATSTYRLLSAERFTALANKRSQ